MDIVQTDFYEMADKLVTLAQKFRNLANKMRETRNRINEIHEKEILTRDVRRSGRGDMDKRTTKKQTI